MDILLIGKTGAVMDALVNKLYKEGHRIYLLTGNNIHTEKPRKIFEQYCFAYDNSCMKEIFESIRPDVSVFLGAFDTNYRWESSRNDAAGYSAGLMNLLMAVSSIQKGRFIYLSSHQVYGKSYEGEIDETVEPAASSFQAMALLQGEKQCLDYGSMMGIDTVVLRLEQFCALPGKNELGRDVCSRMCMEALQSGKIRADKRHVFSLIYLSDAVECVYQIITSSQLKAQLYHIATSQVLDEPELARGINLQMGGNIEIEEYSGTREDRVILSNRRFDDEFRLIIYHNTDSIVKQMSDYFLDNRKKLLSRDREKESVLKKWVQRLKLIFQALVPFLENMVCFIPFFMLNNRAVGSQYFKNFDFYLLYVILFAVIYGQQQATFSALLAVAGYIFRQMYTRSSFEVMLDYNTYIWVAQLFVVGMVVGYLRDKLLTLRQDKDREIDYLKAQLEDIHEINRSNASIKNILTNQIVNQSDSIGKIYDITSSLDKYEAGEVLFYAAEVLSRLMKTKDVAVYTVANRSYARLFSATSPKARGMGNSIDYTKLKDMYTQLQEGQVYINKELEEEYPLMASGIYEDDELKIILMLWGIPWERMTLSQANMLHVIGYLIFNAVIRANRYLEALERERYISGTKILDKEAFQSVVRSYLTARERGLTECCILQIQVPQVSYETAGEKISRLIRDSDFLGYPSDNLMYALLANTSDAEAQYVLRRLEKEGFQGHIQEAWEL